MWTTEKLDEATELSRKLDVGQQRYYAAYALAQVLTLATFALAYFGAPRPVVWSVVALLAAAVCWWLWCIRRQLALYREMDRYLEAPNEEDR